MHAGPSLRADRQEAPSERSALIKAEARQRRSPAVSPPRRAVEVFPRPPRRAVLGRKRDDGAWSIRGWIEAGADPARHRGSASSTRNRIRAGVRAARSARSGAPGRRKGCTRSRRRVTATRPRSAATRSRSARAAIPSRSRGWFTARRGAAQDLAGQAPLLDELEGLLSRLNARIRRDAQDGAHALRVPRIEAGRASQAERIPHSSLAPPRVPADESSSSMAR